MTRLLIALITGFTMLASVAMADTLAWRGPEHTLTVGLSDVDVAHLEMPESIANISVEDVEYVDILVVKGSSNRAFRMRSLLPKMATRVFMTGASGRTYILILTTDVPYRAFMQVVDGTELDDLARKAAEKFDMNDMIRAMVQDQDIPGVVRETHVIPNWFNGPGVSFELAEIWQSSLLTGLVVHVQNQYPSENEVNLPAITIPKTSEWGVLRKASMENMRLAPKGTPNDEGMLYLIFSR
jgi:hypothetical protein